MLLRAFRQAEMPIAQGIQKGHSPTFTHQYHYVYPSIPLRLPINTTTFTLRITTIYFNVVITSKKIIVGYERINSKR